MTMTRKLWTVALMLLATLALASGGARADVFHLSTGGLLEGDLVSETETELVVKLGGGTVTLGRQMVVRVEKAPPVTEQYRERLARLKPTAEDHVELAGWCEDKFLSIEAQKHYAEALGLDADNAVARARLGFVRVKDKWLTRAEARKARVEITQSRKKTVDPNYHWRAKQFRKQFSSLSRGPLSGWAHGDAFVDAREKVLAITDTAAVEPLYETFAKQKEPAKRQLMVDALARIGGDLAADKLVDVLGKDPDDAVAERARVALEEMRSETVPLMLNNLMRTGDARARDRAARAMAGAGPAAMSGVPHLIRNLITREQKIIHHVPTGSQRSWFATGTNTAYVSDLTPVVAEAAVGWDPTISYVVSGAVLDVKAQFEPWNEYVWVTVRHEDVLASLQRITGQSFGWDVRAWYRWYWHSYMPTQGTK
jgi:hypothetical protein